MIAVKPLKTSFEKSMQERLQRKKIRVSVNHEAEFFIFLFNGIFDIESNISSFARINVLKVSALTNLRQHLRMFLLSLLRHYPLLWALEGSQVL